MRSRRLAFLRVFGRTNILRGAQFRNRAASGRGRLCWLQGYPERR